MKYLYAIIFLLLFASSADAQKIRFCDTSNKWKVTVNNIINPFACNNYAFRQWGADTMFNGLYYRYLSDQSTAYIREDTILGKVFYRTTDSDTIERLLYDYNWQVGDTNFYQTYFYVVSAIDSVQVNNIWHKVWTGLHSNGTVQTAFSSIIEGVGDEYGPLFPLFPSTLDNCRYLRCFENNGIRPTMSDFVGSFDNSNSCTLSTSNINGTTQQIFTVPNPVTGDSKIIFNSTIKSGQLTILNTIGQKIVDAAIENIAEYRIGDKIATQGLYYFILADYSDNSKHTGKFVY